MNRKYKFHPGEYELGENEKFYSDMEARGWRLVKRGRYLSRFAPVEPSAARYRIEVYTPPFLEDRTLPEGQLAVFEDCGWEYAADHGFLHIFRAPEGSDAPEFYADPVQQAETLKRVRRDLWWSMALSAAVLGVWVLLAAGIGGSSFGRFSARTMKRAVQVPTLYGSYAFWLTWAVWQMLWGTWKINRTYFRLKKGRPMDHAPKGNRVLHKFLNQGLLCLSLLCLLLTAGQLLLTRSEELPLESGGPYILLDNLGYEGERGALFYRDRESEITRTRSFLSDYWEVFEVIDRPGGGTAWMYQYVYRLRFPGMADRLARALMEDSVFARDADDYHPVEAPGLDRAWATGGLELVAVKGDMVVYVECMMDTYDNFDPQLICASLAERWAAG